MTPLSSAVRNALVSAPDTTRLSSLRRSTTLFSQGQPAEAIFFIEDGLVKCTRTNDHGGRIILSICGPGHLVGEEALSEEVRKYYTDSEVLSTANIYRLTRETMANTLAGNSDIGKAVTAYLIQRKLGLALKVELLCLHDVEYRILHYLAELSALVKPMQDADGYQVPITQLELADLIGATRETTSTTLNQLERRGLVKLSRRLLTIPSPHTLREAATAKTAPENSASVSLL